MIGFVFGEMWRRGVLTARDRRFITLSCVGAAGIITPDRDPRLGGAQQRRPDLRRVRRVRALLRHPAGLAEGLGAEHARDDVRLQARRGAQTSRSSSTTSSCGPSPPTTTPGAQRGEAAYVEVHGVPEPAGAHGLPQPRLPGLPLRRDLDPHASTSPAATGGSSSICCAAAAGVDEEVAEHLRATLANRASSPTRSSRSSSSTTPCTSAGTSDAGSTTSSSRRPGTQAWRPRERHHGDAGRASSASAARAARWPAGSSTPGFPTTLWARRPESLEPFGDTAAHVAATPS